MPAPEPSRDDSATDAALEPTSRPQPKRGEVAKAIWQAFADHLGYSPATDSEKGKWRRGIKELQDAGITDVHIPELIRGYEEVLKYPGTNPKSLASNIAKTKAELQKEGSEASTKPNGAADYDGYVDQQDWRNHNVPACTDSEDCLVRYYWGPGGVSRWYDTQVRLLAKRKGWPEERERTFHRYLEHTNPTVSMLIEERRDECAWPGIELPPLLERVTFEEYCEQQTSQVTS